MELVPQRQTPEQTLSPREIAEGIHAEIVKSVKRLEALHGPKSRYSLLTELRDEEIIADRAVKRFKNSDLPVEVA